MSTIVNTARDLAVNAGNIVGDTTNRVFPPKQRERALENARTFSVGNPKLAVSIRPPDGCDRMLTQQVVSRSSDCLGWSARAPVPRFRHCNPLRFPRYLRAARGFRSIRLHLLRHRIRPPLCGSRRCCRQLHSQYLLLLGPRGILVTTTNQWR